MARHLEAQSTRFSRFELLSMQLSDRMIQPVIPKGKSRDHTLTTDVIPTYPEGVDQGLTSDDTQSDTTSTCNISPSAKTRQSYPLKRKVYTKEEIARISEMKKNFKREQHRLCQARYRQRHRNREQQIEHDVHQLQEETQSLKCEMSRLQNLTRPGPWSIVSAVFRLLDMSFKSHRCVASVGEMKRGIDMRGILSYLQRGIASDVAVGELIGFDALLEQVRRYSMQFENPQLKPKRMEAIGPGIMRVTAAFSVTITEFALQNVFVRLKKLSNNNKGQELRSRLAGQRLTCSCTMAFLLNEETRFMERIETNIDLLGPLIHVLGDVEMASIVYEEFLIECTSSTEY